MYTIVYYVYLCLSDMCLFLQVFETCTVMYYMVHFASDLGLLGQLNQVPWTCPLCPEPLVPSARS